MTFVIFDYDFFKFNTCFFSYIFVQILNKKGHDPVFNKARGPHPASDSVIFF